MHVGPFSSSALRGTAPRVLFRSQKATVVPKRAAGDAGPGASRKSTASPFFTVFLVLPAAATPQQTNLPAPAPTMGPENPVNREDEFNVGTRWWQLRCLHGWVCPRFPNQLPAATTPAQRLPLAYRYEWWGVRGGVCRAYSFSQQVVSLSAFLLISRSCFLRRPGPPRRGCAGMRGGFCGWRVEALVMGTRGTARGVCAGKAAGWAGQTLRGRDEDMLLP